MKSNDIRPGMAINMNGELFVVTKIQHVKPGKGPAYMQVKMKSVTSGGVSEKRLRAAEDVDKVDLDRREMEYLYSDGTGHIFMDNETFDQITVDGDLIGDMMLYVKPNTSIEALVYNGNIISIDLPKVVDLLVTDTAPVPKGATATNQLKEAELETGLKTRVPPFISNGEIVRINTEDASYLSRVND